MSKFRLPLLPWPSNALEPFLSVDTIETHYYGHHKGYVEKTNELVEKLGLESVSLEKIILNYDGTLYDNAAQAWNHTFFWLGLTPVPAGPRSGGKLMKAIDEQFGSLEGMGNHFSERAANLFGSGYTWLICNDAGELDFINTHNADNPVRFESTRPLWTCDVWEHAYYLDYRNQRTEFVKAAWSHVNWDFVERCFETQTIPDMSRLMMDVRPDAGVSAGFHGIMKQ